MSDDEENPSPLYIYEDSDPGMRAWFAVWGIVLGVFGIATLIIKTTPDAPNSKTNMWSGVPWWIIALPLIVYPVYTFIGYALGKLDLYLGVSKVMADSRNGMVSRYWAFVWLWPVMVVATWLVPIPFVAGWYLIKGARVIVRAMPIPHLPNVANSVRFQVEARAPEKPKFTSGHDFL